MLLAFLADRPLLRILNLSNTRISVFPEVEEFLVMFDGYADIIPNSFSSAVL